MTTVLIVVTYAVLYRTAEQLAGVSRSNRRVSGRGSLLPWLERRLQLRPPLAAVLGFMVKGLARSRLNQFVFILIAGAGAAVLIEQVATVMHMRALPRTRVAVHAALAAPLLAALAVTLGLRAAFLLPIDRAAAWVFRLTEDADTRTSALDAVAWFFTGCVLIASLAVALIVQPAVFRASWLLAAGLSSLASLVAVEVVLADWNRIPFTCSYLPGKRVLAYNLGVLLGGYFVFVYMGAHLLRWSLSAPLRTAMVAGLLTDRVRGAPARAPALVEPAATGLRGLRSAGRQDSRAAPGRALTLTLYYASSPSSSSSSSPSSSLRAWKRENSSM